MPVVSVGPYRVLEHLGAGANGAVFLAEDTRLHRRVALKTLVAAPGGDIASKRARLLREARAAARLNHPRIAAVYDVIEGDDEVHIVMEHVQGTTLSARLRSGPLPPMQVLDLGAQLARALAHAHGMGVIHRDLKPANIMITPQGEAKILDFGLARLNEVDAGSVPLSASGSTGVDGRVAGTPPYIPPEVLRGEPADARGDIYSLGVTLFELLTGRRPFEAGNGMALTAAILTTPTPRSRSIGADIPPGLDAIVYRAMSRDPSSRHASAADLASDLERATAAITDPSTRSAEGGLVTRALGAPRRAMGMAVLSALAIAAALFAIRRPNPPATSVVPGQEVIAVLPLHAAADDPAEQSVAAGLADSLTIALARVPGVTVASRDATSGQAGEHESTDVIARRLGATRLVDGTVQRSGQKLRVNLTVSRVGSNAVAWAGGFDGSLDDVFVLQNRAAAGLLEGLGATVPEGFVTQLAPPTRDTDAFADYMQARAFLERADVKGNLDRSIALFESAVHRDPNFARAHAGLGEAAWRKYAETDDRAWSIRARESTLEAMRRDPKDAGVRYALAVIYQATGRVPEAMEEARTAISLQPTNDEAHNLLGQLLAGAGQLDAGLVEIRAAIELRRQYWRHHLALGNVLYDAGRYAEAVNAFRRVTELQPDSAWGYQMLGTSYHALGDRPRAVENYQRAIALGDARAYSNLGTLLYEDHRFPEAARAYEEALRREPGSPSKHRNLGDVYARMGDRERARGCYRRAAELTREQLLVNPRDFLNVARLAVYEAKLGHHDEAARLASRAVAGSPGNPEITYRQAVVHTLAGRLDEALRALGAAIGQGYSVSFIAGDDDFATLRKRAEFARLINKAGLPAGG